MSSFTGPRHLFPHHALDVSPGQLPVGRGDEMGIGDQGEEPEMQMGVNEARGEEFFGKGAVHVEAFVGLESF